MNNHLKTVSLVSALFVIKEEDKNLASSVKHRTNYYKTIPGIIWPNDWDELPLEERKKRLDRLDSLGLGEGN